MARNTYAEPPLNPRDDSHTIGSSIRKVLLGFAAVLALLTLWLSTFKVQEGEVGIVKRGGAFLRIADPGYNVKIPWVDTMEPIEVRQRASHLDIIVPTKDPIALPIKATVNWFVNKPAIEDLYKTYGSMEQFEARIVIPAFQSAIKDATGRIELASLFGDRTKLETDSLALTKAKTPAHVMSIASMFITDINFPDAYEQQILDKRVAEEAVKTQVQATLKQQEEVKQTVQKAQADSDAAKKAADGVAYAIEQKGISEAKAIELRAKALASNPAGLEYERIRAWAEGGKFPETFMGGDAAANVLWNLPGKPLVSPAP